MPRDICIVNAGLHDMEINKGAMQSEQSVINVDSYMKFSSVKGVEKYIHLQNNPKISEWKQGSGKNVDTKTFFHRCKICTKGVHVQQFT